MDHRVSFEKRTVAWVLFFFGNPSSVKRTWIHNLCSWKGRKSPLPWHRRYPGINDCKNHASTTKSHRFLCPYATVIHICSSLRFVPRLADFSLEYLYASDDDFLKTLFTSVLSSEFRKNSHRRLLLVCGNTKLLFILLDVVSVRCKRKCSRKCTCNLLGNDVRWK